MPVALCGSLRHVVRLRTSGSSFGDTRFEALSPLPGGMEFVSEPPLTRIQFSPFSPRSRLSPSFASATTMASTVAAPPVLLTFPPPSRRDGNFAKTLATLICFTFLVKIQDVFIILRVKTEILAGTPKGSHYGPAVLSSLTLHLLPSRTFQPHRPLPGSLPGSLPLRGLCAWLPFIQENPTPLYLLSNSPI